MLMRITMRSNLRDVINRASYKLERALAAAGVNYAGPYVAPKKKIGDIDTFKAVRTYRETAWSAVKYQITEEQHHAKVFEQIYIAEMTPQNIRALGRMKFPDAVEITFSPETAGSPKLPRLKRRKKPVRP